MTNTQRPPRVAVTAVRVHPFYYYTAYGVKQRFQHFLNQLSRAIAMLLYGACFIQIAYMAAQIPFIVHLPMLWGFLAVIIRLVILIHRSAAGRANFKKYDNLKKTCVVYTHTRKARCANDNK